ncbi:glycosyltransferase family 2 protein [Hespellia stercorisuis]|uniref:Dolichol-phosphate mannosyltransferase n=1 Tax=Hespellia stercorisuis DSM 15480 TaxID=1121950 RepID=A0A1M6V1Q7_9FIRM|nr:glycosyltransferase family 2 protein [Hespellia stercorisuis]SHK75447.1 dolichol-phosphate mannosyltransferase [Hespellia stercorisuis DSM 15480]
MEKLSIIIPVYYNEENLHPLYDDLKEKVLAKLPCDYEIVFVNDGSKDGSYDKLKELADMDPKVKLVNLARNFGEHLATLAGLSECSGTVAVRKAADLQEPSEMILQMYEKYAAGSKVVLAVREDREEPISQKLFSEVYCWMMRKFALSNMPKGGFDTFMISRQVIDIIVEIGEKNAPLTEQILWSGFESEKIYYVRKKREIGKSGWTLSKKIKLAIDSLLSFSYFPIRCISVMGVVSILVSLIWTLVLVVDYLDGHTTVEGYTTIVVLILLSFGITMLTLGILGEYIWRMFDEVRNRPAFIVDEVRQNKTDPCGAEQCETEQRGAKQCEAEQHGVEQCSARKYEPEQYGGSAER